MAIVVEDAAGERVLDVLIPGGTYDPTLRVGWESLRTRDGWRYRNRTDAPPGGIHKIVIRDLSRREPGTLKFRVSGRRGSYPVAVDRMPLRAIFSIDPPTAETGQCSDVLFPSPGACAHTGKAATCR